MKFHNSIFLLLTIAGFFLTGSANLIITQTFKTTPVEKFNYSKNQRAESSSVELLKFVIAVCSDFNNDHSLRISFGLFIGLLGSIIVPIGAGFYAVGKNRSKWFCLLGLFPPIGFAILAILEDRNNHKKNRCTTSHSRFPRP